MRILVRLTGKHGRAAGSGHPRGHQRNDAGRHPVSRIPLYAPPRLLVRWQSRWAEFPGNLRAVLAPSRVTPAMLAGFVVPLRGGAMRPRSLGASLAAHLAVVLVLVNLSWMLGWRRPLTAAEQAYLKSRKISWYYYNDELPAISPEPGSGEKRSEQGGQRPGPSPRGATAFHPQQVIISNPPQPDNARQTIVQPEAPNIRILRDVRAPNVVMWAHQPQRPSLEFLPAPDVRISQPPRLLAPPDIVRPLPPVDLVKREVAGLNAPQLGVAAVEPPAPEAPNLERRISDLKIAASKALEHTPQLAVPAGTTAPITRANSDSRTAPAELPAPPPVAAGANSGGVGRLIALGIDPAPPGGSISVPVGNRAGSFSIAPSGKTPGTPTAADSRAGSPGARAGGPALAGDGAGEGPVVGPGAGAGPREVAEIRVPGLSVSGGVRPPSAALGPVVSGPLPEPPAPRPPASPRAANTNALAALVARATRPQTALPEWGLGDRRAQQGFLSGKKVYTVYINMPNLSSQSGSWILRFAEMADRAPGSSTEDEPQLTAPVALRKVDPGYHPSAIREGVQGVVVLYAVIHRDGSVDSVRVVRGLDPRLDERAVKALLRWEFQPAARNGSPVDLEALVQIPFSLNGGKPGE